MKLCKCKKCSNKPKHFPTNNASQTGVEGEVQAAEGTLGGYLELYRSIFTRPTPQSSRPYKSIFTQPTPQQYKTEEVSFHSAAPTMRNVKIDFHSTRYHHFHHLHWIEISHYLPAGAWKPRTQCFCGELASWSTGKTPQRLWRRWLCQRLRSDHRGNSQARPNREEAAKAACEAAEAEFQACSQVAKGEVSKKIYFMHDMSMWCQIRMAQNIIRPFMMGWP